MKRLLSAVLAVSLLGGTAAMAQPDHHDNRDNRGGYDQGRAHDQGRGHQDGAQYRHWARGQRLPANYYSDRGHYVDYRAHHLRRPPRGYQWVEADNNYALVALTSGLIASVIAANH
jgi:Ni/Co efflux regulator RcnB